MLTVLIFNTLYWTFVSVLWKWDPLTWRYTHTKWIHLIVPNTPLDFNRCRAASLTDVTSMEYCRRRYLRLAVKDIGLVRWIKQWQFRVQSHCQLITNASVITVNIIRAPNCGTQVNIVMRYSQHHVKGRSAMETDHRTRKRGPSKILSCYNYTKVGTLIVATIYLQLIQNRYMFRSFTVLQCSHQFKPLWLRLDS